MRFAEPAECFNRLADMIARHRDLARSCQFIFLPGPTDPWASLTFPCPPLPDFFVGRVRERLPGAQFVSNPCR